EMQRTVLNRLYHPVLLARILDSEVKTDHPFTVADLFTELQDAIWSETSKSGAALNINTYRRSLQREHLHKLTQMLLRNEGNPPEDARTMARASLLALRTQLKNALARPGKVPSETRAHLQESLARVSEALSASAQRTAL